MEESTVRNSRIGETREVGEKREKEQVQPNTYKVGRIQKTEPAVDMMWKQRGYGKTQRQKKTTTGVLLQEQRHSKGWKQEV